MVEHVTPNQSKSGGKVNSAVDGTKFVEAFGKDDSDYSGSASMERYGKKMGGGKTDISHSIKGATANLSGT